MRCYVSHQPPPSTMHARLLLPRKAPRPSHRSPASPSSPSPARRSAAIRRSRALLPPSSRSSFSATRPPRRSSMPVVSAGFGGVEMPGSAAEEEQHEDARPFDINLAVLLAGFAFESYNTPSEKDGVHEVDGFDTKTIFLSKKFLQDVYDGQLFIQLRKGSQFPGMDLWGTSDPYVIMRVGECIVKSRIIWGTKDPVWNEVFSINVKKPVLDYMQVTAWDANILGSHRRMGNAGVKMDSICDGERHEICVMLEGMGGGGILYLEVQYKSFSQDEEKGKRIPSLPEFCAGGNFDAVFKTIFGIEGIKIRDFLVSTIGSTQDTGDGIKKERTLDLSQVIESSETSEAINKCNKLVHDTLAVSDQVEVMASNKTEGYRISNDVNDVTKQSVREGNQNYFVPKIQVSILGKQVQDFFQSQIAAEDRKKHFNDVYDMLMKSAERLGNCLDAKDDASVSGKQVQDFIQSFFSATYNEEGSIICNDVHDMTKQSVERENANFLDTDDQIIVTTKYVQYFFQSLFADINKMLGDTSLGNLLFHHLNKLDASEPIKRLGMESQNKAESYYIENGMALPKDDSYERVHPNDDTLKEGPSSSLDMIAVDLDIKKASIDLLRQMEEILGFWAMLAASLTCQKQKREDHKNNGTKVILNEPLSVSTNDSDNENGGKHINDAEMEDLRKMFKTAESAMEAWAILASSIGCPSSVKSEFEKLCFLENKRTDTQVCIWQDLRHHRLVISFRGTEQVKWKDLRTDLMILPTGFNPERVAGNFKQEIMVHSGFLSAYDSVKSRLMSLLKASIQYSENQFAGKPKWHIYSTGHSLGGALATLFALDLSLSQLYKTGYINITMYNFGSPRLGNKKFADLYNQKVNDSWRVVNHQDIIPTVPRLMGYHHVAHPIYLSVGALSCTNVEMGLVEDGYKKDVIGEATPDFLVQKFMEGEKDLIQRLLQTEITMLRALRDGSALMQHMEDFYYISLLERVSPSQIVGVDSKRTS